MGWGEQWGTAAGGTAGDFQHQILSPALGWAVQHGANPVSISKIAGREWSSCIAEATALLRGRGQIFPSPKETPAAAVGPVGSSSSQFGTTLPKGAGKLRIVLLLIPMELSVFLLPTFLKKQQLHAPWKGSFVCSALFLFPHKHRPSKPIKSLILPAGIMLQSLPPI